MEEREFVAGSRVAWQRLAAAVTEARSAGVARLGAARLRQMHEDYRSAAADLAYAQTHYGGGDTEAYLNRLVGQAHGEVYGAAPRRLAAVWRFLAVEYPRLLRRLWKPIALSAAELLTSPHLARVRECSGDRCDWLFVDTSRNHLRRWCSMAECGNRSKSQRFLARKRKRRTH